MSDGCTAVPHLKLLRCHCLVLQIAASIIAIFGFNGYDYPMGKAFDDCQFCRLAYKPRADGSESGGYPAFFSRTVPQYRTENMYVDSTIGCT